MNITRQAAEWMLELQRKDLSEVRIAAWQRWLQERPENQQAFDDLQRIQECIDKAPALPWPVEDARRGRHVGTRMRFGLALAASIVIALSVGVALYRKVGPVSLTTAVGEVRNVRLADGTTMTLGGRSRANVEMVGKGRLIALTEGEAFFDVAPDARRPFVVTAGEAQVRALGTGFEVWRAGDHVIVTVETGSVEVSTSASGAAERLDAGQEIRVAGVRFAGRPARVSPATVAGWREGRHQYFNESLADVIADLNRYSTHPIVIDDSAPRDLPVTGTIFDGEIDGWLRSLPHALPVSVTTRGDRSVHIASQSHPEIGNN